MSVIQEHERFSNGTRLALALLVNTLVPALGNLLLIGRTAGNFICMIVCVFVWSGSDWRVILAWTLFMDIRAYVDIYITPEHIKRTRASELAASKSKEQKALEQEGPTEIYRAVSLPDTVRDSDHIGAHAGSHPHPPSPPPHFRELPAGNNPDYLHGVPAELPANGKREYSHGAPAPLPASSNHEYSHGALAPQPASSNHENSHGALAPQPASSNHENSHGALAPQPASSKHEYSHGAPAALETLTNADSHQHKSPAARLHEHATHSTTTEHGLSHGAPQLLNETHTNGQHAHIHMNTDGALEPLNSPPSPGSTHSAGEHTLTPVGPHVTSEHAAAHVVNQQKKLDLLLHSAESGSAGTESKLIGPEHSVSANKLEGDDKEGGVVYDLYSDGEEENDRSRLSPFEEGVFHKLGESAEPGQSSAQEVGNVASQDHSHGLKPVDYGNPDSAVRLDSSQLHSKHVQICLNCGRAREHNRPSCPACGTHFEERSV